MSIDTAQIVTVIYMLWEFTVQNFGNPIVFQIVIWPIASIPIFLVATELPIQIFLSYRIKVFSKSWIWFIIVASLSLVAGCCGIACGVLATLIPSIPTELKRLVPLADASIGIFVFNNILMTSLLFFFLKKSKTGFQRTDSLIQNLFRIAVQTAFISSIICVIQLILFTIMDCPSIIAFLELLHSRLFVNTLMFTLNSRANFREKLKTDEIQFCSEGIPDAFRIKPAEISISVQQDNHVDDLGSRSSDETEKKRFYAVERVWYFRCATQYSLCSSTIAIKTCVRCFNSSYLSPVDHYTCTHSRI